MGVLERNSRADRTFPGSPFRRALRPASLQRIRLRPSPPTARPAPPAPPPLAPLAVPSCTRAAPGGSRRASPPSVQADLAGTARCPSTSHDILMDRHLHGRPAGWPLRLENAYDKPFF